MFPVQTAEPLDGGPGQAVGKTAGYDGKNIKERQTHNERFPPNRRAPVDVPTEFKSVATVGGPGNPHRVHSPQYGHVPGRQAHEVVFILCRTVEQATEWRMDGGHRVSGPPNARCSTRRRSMPRVSGKLSTISGRWSVNEECTTANIHPGIFAFQVVKVITQTQKQFLENLTHNLCAESPHRKLQTSPAWGASNQRLGCLTEAWKMTIPEWVWQEKGFHLRS